MALGFVAAFAVGAWDSPARGAPRTTRANAASRADASPEPTAGNDIARTDEPDSLPAPAERAAEMRAATFGAHLQRGELDAALELWPRLAANEREQAWRALVAQWIARRPDEARPLAEVARVAGGGAWFEAVIAAWAESSAVSPAALQSYAQELPAGRARFVAFDAAVRSGTQRDPAAVAAWLPALRDADELDFAAAHLVAHTDALFRPTAQALEWAALIRDPERRGAALGAVVREWAARDRPAAQAFAATSEALSPEQRTALLASLTQRPDPQ